MTKRIPKKILRKSRHIRWYHHKSPDSLDSLRYHFVIVDDRGRGHREDIFESITGQLQQLQSIEMVGLYLEGRVLDSKFGCLYGCFDSPIASRELNLSKIDVPKRWDKRLRSRVRRGFSVGDYVTNLYGLS